MRQVRTVWLSPLEGGQWRTPPSQVATGREAVVQSGLSIMDAVQRG